MSLAERLAGHVLLNETLAKYTAARLGGPADLLYVARSSISELAEIVSAAWVENVPVRVLGGGANVLVSDQGVRGLVVINHIDHVEFETDGTVTATSGTSLTTLARRLALRGLAGFEWAVSVPGTVGGAVVNNAGAHGGSMADCVKFVTLLDANSPTPRLLRNSDLAYDYRQSSLKRSADRRFLVLDATFAFTSDDPAQINARMDANIAHRKRTQPPGASLGSIFKNPPGDYAGRLIESAGLKGYRIGGAQVSPVHANFFINTGAATASDYYALILHVRDDVRRQTGVMLEMEVELVGEEFSG
jgi:UDP-N-acetylmuramate dehydrogenase